VVKEVHHREGTKGKRKAMDIRRASTELGLENKGNPSSTVWYKVQNKLRREGPGKLLRNTLACTAVLVIRGSSLRESLRGGAREPEIVKG